MNSVVRPQTTLPVAQGNWWWDGSNWQCGCDGNPDLPPWCPPPSWPPAGCPPWFSGANSPPWYPGANAGVSFGTTAPLNPVRGHFWWDGTTLWLFDGAAWVDSAAGATSGVLAPGAGTVSVQTTAPGSPVKGSQWWNGTSLYVWDGSAWKLVGPGASTGPVSTTTQTFNIYQSNTTFTSGAWTLFPWTSSPSVNTGTWDNIQHKFTPTKAGYRTVQLLSYFTDTGTGPYDGRGIFMNDPGSLGGAAVAINDTQTYSGTGSAGWLSSTGVIYMNGTTDYLRYWAIARNGSSVFDQMIVHLLP